MAEAPVTVIALRPYVRDAIEYQPGDPFAVPVLEALELATKGIVSLSRRPGAKRADPIDKPRRKVRKSAA